MISQIKFRAIDLLLKLLSKETRSHIANRLKQDAEKFTLHQQVLKLTKQFRYLIRRDILRDFPYDRRKARFSLHAASLYSQNGEDGMLIELLRRIGPPTYKCIEVCCGDNGGNTGILAFELGWKALLIDGSERLIDNLKRRFEYDPAEVKIECKWVTAENINQIISDGGLGGEVDVFSLDMDGMDYWVLKNMSACNPRVMILEYNSFFGPERSVTIPYAQKFDRKEFAPFYFGASLRAMVRLAREKGYRLIAIEPRGVNAFFLRQDILKDDLPEIDAHLAFRGISQIKESYAGQMVDNDVFKTLESRGLKLQEV